MKFRIKKVNPGMLAEDPEAWSFPSRMYVDNIRIYSEGQGEENQTIAIKAVANDKYVCADLGISNPPQLFSNRTGNEGWERFWFINQ